MEPEREGFGPTCFAKVCKTKDLLRHPHFPHGGERNVSSLVTILEKLVIAVETISGSQAILASRAHVIQPRHWREFGVG